MSDTERSLLAAVCAQPGEDTPRLAYADWCGENGRHERAAYIRYHITGQQPPFGLMLDASPDLQWVPPLPRRTRRERIDGVEYLDGDGRAMVLTFARGFPDSLTCTAADFLAHADALCWHPGQDRPCPETAMPIVRVVLTTVPPLDHCGGDPFQGWGEYSHEKWRGIEFVLPLYLEHLTFAATVEALDAAVVASIAAPPAAVTGESGLRAAYLSWAFRQIADRRRPPS